MAAKLGVGVAALALLASLSVAGEVPSEQPYSEEEAWLMRDVLHRVHHGHPVPQTTESAPTRSDTDVLHYEIRLFVDTDADTLGGETDVTIRSEIDGLTEIGLHLRALTVHGVTRGLTPLAFVHVGEDLTITLDQPINSGESVVLTIAYSGVPDHESWGGFWFFGDMAFSIGVGVYTDPPSMGRYWFPCFDEPHDKAAVTAHYTVLDGNSAVGNGLLTGIVEHPLEGTVTYTWEEAHQIATYLVAVAVADWRTVTDPVYPELIYHYVTPDDSTDAVGSFQNVSAMMDAFTTRYAPYQYDKFSFVGVRRGDMEHQTCVAHLKGLINGGTFYDFLLAHELSHHWWGDWVTVADWRDVWLSEGFATYSEAVYKEHIGGMSAYHTYMNTSILDYYLNSGETFPIYDPIQMWGATSYEKGASVLHMLRHIVGTETFLDILQTWGATYGFGNALTPDFVEVAETVSGQELSWFFDEWIYEAGYPVYEWSWNVSAGRSDTLSIQVDQVQSIGPVFRMPIDFRVTLASGDSTVTATIDQASQLATFAFEETPLDVAFDPDRWVLCLVDEVNTGVESPPVGGVFALAPAGPNPFAAATTMRLSVPDTDLPVELGIYDGSGRLIRTLISGSVEREEIIEWDARDDAGKAVASGVYFMRARRGEEALTRRLIVLR